MEHIYLVLVDTPGIFACMIRHFLKQKYIHVAISMDEGLEDAYSVGRRNPFIPVFAGFEKEEKNKIVKAFPTAKYMVCELECTRQQKEAVQKRLYRDMEKRFRYHYAVLGLPFILFNRPFYQKNHFTCSSYLAKLLEENKILSFGKHFSLVTPKDFFEYPDKKILFEGPLSEFTGSICQWKPEREAVYGQ